jgi:hypothetical protein
MARAQVNCLRRLVIETGPLPGSIERSMIGRQRVGVALRRCIYRGLYTETCQFNGG